MLTTALLFLVFCLPLWMPLSCVPILRKHNPGVLAADLLFALLMAAGLYGVYRLCSPMDEFTTMIFFWTWLPLLLLAALWTLGMAVYRVIRERAEARSASR
jgi:hypothetical protein